MRRDRVRSIFGSAMHCARAGVKAATLPAPGTHAQLPACSGTDVGAPCSETNAKRTQEATQATQACRLARRGNLAKEKVQTGGTRSVVLWLC